MSHSARSFAVPFVVGSALLFCSPAIAADPIAIADEIVAAVVDETRTATYETATEAGGVVTVTNFVVTDAPNRYSGTIRQIVVVNPVEREDGGFTADTIRLVDGNVTDQANILRWEVVELQQVVVPPLADLAAEGGPELPLAGVIVTNAVLDPPQANDVIVAGVELLLGDAVEGVPYTIAVTVTGVEVPMDFADNTEPFTILADMGFERLVMDFTVAGTFDAENDTLYADAVSINIHDLGRIEISGVFSGLPLSLLQEPSGIDLLLASAMVDSVRIRFENSGLMQTFMRIQGDLMGVPAEDAAFGLAAAFQIFLQVEMPDLDPQIGVAVGAFLRNPQSITIVADPDEPVPLLAVLPLILGDPNALPTLLEVVVTAND